MCGIVGYIGPQNAVKVVLDGLERLEYRGYDSAGISLIDENNQLVMFKKIGKLNNLKEVVFKEAPESHQAIGHTRWATHGHVTQENAHPHQNEMLSMVHNGIIENAADLRERLLDEGFMFSSETDSEVFLVLMEKGLKEEKLFSKAIVEAFSQLTGNSAFVITNREEQAIYCIRRGAPIVCGLNSSTGEVLASSDPYALVGTADQLFFPGDNVLVKLDYNSSDKIKFYDFDLKETDKYETREQMMTLNIADKGPYEHFMIKEIHEQPQLMREILDYYQKGDGREKFKKIIDNEDIQRIHIVACGTAWHAGLVAKRMFEEKNRFHTFVDLASEFRYGKPLLKQFDGAVFISQSGETADTLAALELVKQEHPEIPTLAIVNVEGSTLFRDCRYNLLIRAGFEIGVASTKAFTQQVLTAYLLSHSVEGELNHKKVNKEISALADRFEEILAREIEIKDIAESLVNHRGYVFTGRGKYVPIALEGALKLKEIAYVHAEGYPAGELKHGPIALIDDDMVNIAIVGPELYDKMVSNIQEVKARHGIIFAIGPEGDKKLEGISDYYFPISFEGLDILRPLLPNLVLQLFAYYFANFKGTDIDKPRNLAKSVTVE